MKTVFLALIRLYQLTLSPLLGSNCRFVPSCSCYAKDAITLHGPLKGSWLATKRLCRCGPFGTEYVHDPVPAQTKTKASDTPR